MNCNTKSVLKTHGLQKTLCNNFAYAIDYICFTHGLSKAQIARSIGFTPASFTRYCNGERTPNAEAVYLLSEQYHISADFILGTPVIPDREG